MAVVKVNGIERSYSEGTTYLEIAKEFQDQYENDILLVRVNGKLRELEKTLAGDSEISFITAKENAGYKTYERSAIFLMLKAFYEVIPREKIRKIQIDFALENGIYGELVGDIPVDEKLLTSVKVHMEKLRDAAIPVKKRSVNTDDAVELFGKHGMHDKEQLFQYRRASRVNIYSIGEFEDYFYGYMVPDTSYVKYFDLVPCHAGFLLLLPVKTDPKHVEHPAIREKLFSILHSSYRWSDSLEVPNVGALNKMIVDGRGQDLILMQEALQEKNIGQVAEKAVKDPDRRIVMIAGPSSSGKTTFSHRLSTQFAALGYNPHPISVDNYFRNREEYPLDENGQPDFEALGCVDIPQFNEDMNALLSGKTIELPRFNFKTGKREYKGEMLKLGKKDILVIEGIHCLNDAMSSELPKDSKFKIYISALTQLNVDEHNRIPTTDGRLIRRMVRDARTRGTSALETIERWPSVRRGEDKNIFPYQESADVMFNSALVYELAVLKLYAEPLLFNIPRDREEYDEAKRLLKFLDYFLAIDSDVIPKTSILREFIGGSCLNV
ncbi:MAG: nucleoside kinase [Candidatus Copromonas sp.]|uniref:uridine kinase family protein n=1 Tax=Pilosibacter fragilis TaxID=3078042 RepID=UPI002843DA0A|nr:nucleoside kinase [Candidatus Copromonas sp.]